MNIEQFSRESFRECTTPAPNYLLAIIKIVTDTQSETTGRSLGPGRQIQPKNQTNYTAFCLNRVRQCDSVALLYSNPSPLIFEYPCQSGSNQPPPDAVRGAMDNKFETNSEKQLF